MVMFKVNFVFDTETTAQFSAFKRFELLILFLSYIFLIIILIVSSKGNW